MHSNNHYNPNLRKFAHELRNESVSRAEKLLWKSLLARNKQGVKFKRQRPVGYYIVDFLAQEIGLIIEVDGSSHLHKGAYDRRRQDYLESLGYTILRFQEGEVIQNIGDTGERIAHAVYILKERNKI